MSTPSLYLRLIHGRHSPDEQLEDWGFNGPVLGPYEAIHVTYKSHVRAFENAIEVLDLQYHEDMLVYDGKYYGDWEVTTTSPEKDEMTPADAGVAAAIADHPDAPTTNFLNLRCPDCGRADELEVAATLWVRLTPDGTDPDTSANGDHDYDRDSEVRCGVCDYYGAVHNCEQRTIEWLKPKRLPYQNIPYTINKTEHTYELRLDGAVEAVFPLDITEGEILSWLRGRDVGMEQGKLDGRLTIQGEIRKALGVF